MIRRLLAFGIAAGVAAGVASGLPVGAEPDAAPARVAGASRIDTAARLAELGWAAAPTVVIARADDFPDALAAAGLAGALQAPLLLTDPERLPGATAEALARVGAEEVVLLGGEASISAVVEEELTQTYAVRRVWGPNRYATAAEIARDVAALSAVGELDGQTTVLVASGEQFPDALAGGAVAYRGPHPLLLTRRESLPTETAAAVEELAPEQALVLGGTAAVDDGVVRALDDLGVATRRVAGAARTGTAAQLADAAPPPAPAALLVRGDGFADALAAGPYAGAVGAALLLSASPADLGADARSWLASRCGDVTVTAVGGPAALSDGVAAAALRAVRLCEDGLPVRFGYTVGVEADVDEDPAAVAGAVTGTLGDPRGWTQPGLVEFNPADAGQSDFAVVVARPHRIDAEPACRGAAACRIGDTLLIDATAWRQPPPTYAGLPASDYRHYLVNHLVGHWLGLGHAACRGGTALVMQPQSSDLAGCEPGPWPQPEERRTAAGRYVPTVTVAFTGDVHGEGVVREELLAGGNPVAPMAPVLSAADIAVVNLETAVGSTGRPAAKQFTFQAPPQLVTALAAGGVDVVNLANNHALDYGYDALFETIHLARQAGLAVVGAGRDADEAYAPAVLQVGDRTVAVVGLSRVLSPGWAAGPARPGLASAYDEPAAVAAVRRAAALADHVVVTIHWGVELADCPDSHQLRLATLLTDAGAEVVAGHHPHVLQGIQSRNGSLVAYSLGNFVWYHRREPTRYTGVLTAHLPGAAHTFTPAEIDARGSPQPAGGALAAAIHERVTSRSPGGGRCPF